VKTLLQPSQQSRLSAGQVDPTHTDARKSKLMAPPRYAREQLTIIDQQTGVHHLPIVKSLTWPDEAATRLFAGALAVQPALRDSFIELHGDLGAGKTSFVRHLLQALGVTGRIKSPTYAVLEPYELPGTRNDPAPLPIWHFDFYRFDDPREWEDAGFRDIFAGPGLKLAEWPEKVAGMLPLADLALHIDVQADAVRQVRLIAQTAVGAQLLGANGA